MISRAIFDADKIREFYEDYIQITGLTIGWPSADAAYAIYQEASNSPHQRWTQFDSVLDIGSGEGHFAKYLKRSRKFTGQYLGIEILSMFYKKSISLYGHLPKTKFIKGDFLSYEFRPGKFDWVTSLGSLSVLQKRQLAHDLAVCQKIIQLARFGFSIYINDPRDTPSEIKHNTPNLAYHDPHAFLRMLESRFGILTAVAVSFPTDAHSKGTMIHAQLA